DMQGAAPQQGSVYADYGSTVTLPQSGFAKTGYNFTGWAYDGATYTDTFTVPAMAADGADITLAAQWSIGTFTLTFDTDGGNDISPVTGEYGSAITAPADPEKPGYKFTGWTPAVPETMPGENLTVTANWSKLSYRVAFLEPDSVSGDATFANESVFNDYEFYLGYGDALTSIPGGHPEVNNYTFLYWAAAPGGAEVNLQTWTMPAAAEGTVIYFYPVYERVEVEVVIDDTVSDAEIVDDGAGQQVDGYIYNAGTKLTKANLEKQFEVTGDGYVRITPSKGSKICGTGTKIELVDNYDNTVKAVYYLIVPGDVNGDSVCSANDASIVEHARLYPDTSWYLNDKPEDTAEQLAEKARIRECYRLAADVNDQYGTLDDNDTAMIEYYVLGGGSFSYDTQTKKYQLLMA
ncbi:MAG: InlB B-repeat-containing protein, partial [Clostridia bacterium]|nr:InlB B-repeat-containing protein [Clostridia bacterium]